MGQYGLHEPRGAFPPDSGPQAWPYCVSQRLQLLRAVVPLGTFSPRVIIPAALALNSTICGGHFHSHNHEAVRDEHVPRSGAALSGTARGAHAGATAPSVSERAAPQSGTAPSAASLERLYDRRRPSRRRRQRPARPATAELRRHRNDLRSLRLVANTTCAHGSMPPVSREPLTQRQPGHLISGCGRVAKDWTGELRIRGFDDVVWRAR